MSTNPALNPRQQQLADYAQQHGYVTVDELAERMTVTHQTIRRDINLLCDRGILSRFHGGAVFRSSVANLPYETRRDALADEKRRIAEAVARDIPDKSSVFIDIGTTAEAVATALLPKTELRVVTNNINVANILAKSPSCEIVICGGTVRNRDLAVGGQFATDFITKFHVDFAILGLVAIGEDGSILDFFVDEEPLTQAIIRCGRKVLAVADHSKFGRQAIARVAQLSQLDAIYTDALLSAPWQELLIDNGVEIKWSSISRVAT